MGRIKQPQIVGLSISCSRPRSGFFAIFAGGLATIVALVGEIILYWIPQMKVGFAVSEIVLFS